MKILVACECSGRVRDAFIGEGHDALSCDLLASISSGPHYQGDVRDLLKKKWDAIIAFHPCTYLCSSGMHWTVRGFRDPKLTEDAIDFVLEIWNAKCDRIAIENPVGVLSTAIRKPDQIIQPWMFGEDASKRTCLWLKGFPILESTDIIAPRLYNGKPRWANQTPSGQNKLGPSPDRARLRETTYPGIAKAMAKQWGKGRAAQAASREPRRT
jgi:hypothetical protein